MCINIDSKNDQLGMAYYGDWSSSISYLYLHNGSSFFSMVTQTDIDKLKTVGMIVQGDEFSVTSIIIQKAGF
jgi:hypothetical protein